MLHNICISISKLRINSSMIKSIKVYDVEVLSNGPEQNCLACTCTTGHIIKLKVMSGDVAELKTEGFYE